MKVLLRVHLSPYTGYGQDGLALAEAWLRRGADVYLQPASVTAPLPKAVAGLLTKRLDPPFDLAIVHVDPGQLEAGEGMQRASALVLGWTMWEWTALDNMRDSDLATVPTRLASVDALLAYDDVSAAALAEWLPLAERVGGHAPVLATLQGGYAAEQWPEVTRDWHGTFRFYVEGVLGWRKNPFCVIEAFHELRQEHPDDMADTELLLKTTEPGLHPGLEAWEPGLKVLYEVTDEARLRELYAMSHCLVSPSRGEGKNLPALQFLSSGGTAIVTDVGGHRMWLSRDYAYPLSWTPSPVPDAPVDREGRRSSGAEADKDHLKALMLHLVRNRDEARRRGACAARTIPLMCGWDGVLDRLVTRLPELAGRRGKATGEAVRNRALAALMDSRLLKERASRERERA